MSASLQRRFETLQVHGEYVNIRVDNNAPLLTYMQRE